LGTITAIQFLTNIFNQEKKFSFVDNGITTTGRYHLRELTNQGYKLGGGIDTPTLCGIENRSYFDSSLPITATSLKSACPDCVVLYRAEPVY
jgi:hypothetical protein